MASNSLNFPYLTMTKIFLNGISAGVRAILMASAFLLMFQACAGSSWSDNFQLVGHDPLVDPVIRRLTGKVTGLGKVNKDGHIYSIRLEPIGPKMLPPNRNELRGWRLTVLKGARFGYVYWVHSNTSTEITVHSKDGWLDGVVTGDLFVVEQIDSKLLPAAKRLDVGEAQNVV